MLIRLRTLKSKLFADITTVPDALKPSHLPGLDGLRGISIIMVIASHFFMHTSYTKSVVGSIGVWIFFVISGFLITTLLIKEKIKTQKISLKKFYIRRILRIIPVAYLFLIVLAVINHYQKLDIHFISFMSAAFFLQNLPGLGFFNWYVEHFWSLSVEEQFYWTFPILLVRNLNSYIRLVIAFIIIIPIIQFLGFNKVGVFYSNHTVHIIAFIIINIWGNSINILIGSLLSILLFKKIIIIEKIPYVKYLSLTLFIIAVMLCTDTSPLFLPYSELLLFPSLIGLVIILNLNKDSFFVKILNFKFLTYIGVLSYSLYIWQQLFDNPDTWLIKSDSALLHVAAIFICANASYYLFEKFFLRLKDKYKKNIIEK